MNFGRVGALVLVSLFGAAAGIADEQTAPAMKDAAPVADELLPLVRRPPPSGILCTN